jgi:hypothetical protein
MDFSGSDLKQIWLNQPSRKNIYDSEFDVYNILVTRAQYRAGIQVKFDVPIEFNMYSVKPSLSKKYASKLYKSISRTMNSYWCTGKWPWLRPLRIIRKKFINPIIGGLNV